MTTEPTYLTPAALAKTPGDVYVPLTIGDSGDWTRAVKSDLVRQLRAFGVAEVRVSESHGDLLVDTFEVRLDDETL